MPFEKESISGCERGGHRALIPALALILLSLMLATAAARCYRTEAVTLLENVMESETVSVFLGLLTDE
jgi:hypothetical protein